MGFTGKPIALLRIATDTRTNHVLPGRRPAAIARYDVIEIEIPSIENLAAVLASVLVALKDVVPGKLHFFFRKPIENQQHDHARNTNLERNGRDQLVIGCIRREIAPAIEIVSQEIVRLVRGNNLGVARVNQRKRAARGADVHRLPETIQHQNLTVQRRKQISLLNHVGVRVLRAST